MHTKHSITYFSIIVSLHVLTSCASAVDEHEETGGSNSECQADINTWKCDGEILSKCISGEWEIIQTCDNNSKCDADNKTCAPHDKEECTHNTWKCDENILSKCVSERWEIIQHCTNNTQCNAEIGSCQPNFKPECTNDTWKCDGNTLSKCVSENWVTNSICEDNAKCNAEKRTCEIECKNAEHLFAGKCETDDVTHCGTHTNNCTAMSGWKAGTCFSRKCFAEECQPGYHLASFFDSDNEERTICEEDTHNTCGSINHQCGTNEICTQGKCKDTCQPGEVICGGSCINPNTSTKFCGADASCSSYITCSEFEECIAGKCVLSSCQNEEDSLCTANDQIICVDIHGSNPNHCGECGAICLDMENAKSNGCDRGQCTYMCNDGMVNCGSVTEPYCLLEDQLKSDSMHCGKCNTKCKSNEFCMEGQCVVNTCNGNECLLDNACINQNEHCGLQCLNCHTANHASSGICKNGSCVISTCATGYHLTDKGTCEINSAAACPNEMATGTVNCNTLDYTKTGICEEGKCKATTCQSNAHIKDNQCVADTTKSCGSVGNDCTKLAGWKTGDCENAKCVAKTCQSGFCLNTLQNLCTNAQSSTTCGIDGNACQSCNQKQVCNTGICVDKQCEGNVCNQTNISDETLVCENDNTHCGSDCQNCNSFTDHTTTGICSTTGTCQVTACETGYHIYNNACEADSTTNCGTHNAVCDVGRDCVDGTCTCAEGMQLCNSACTNIQTDIDNCGACNNICIYGLDCINGRCLGNANCNGATHNTATDLDHCGECNHKCSDGTTCKTGECLVANGPAYCNTQIVQLNTVEHCESCAPCADGLICENNHCIPEQGRMICNGIIIDSRSDSANCGSCGNVCTAGFECVNSTCKRITNLFTTTITCNAQTVHPYNDRSNCAGCGITCTSEYMCLSGNCVKSLFYFGHYEQDNNTSNGKEPIEWRVLNSVYGGVLVIANKVLDKQLFNTTNISIVWFNSTIRSWLNGYGASHNFADNDYTSDNFIDRAFTVEEKSKIKLYNSDKIFLLSTDEVNSYFISDADRQAEPTIYVNSNCTDAPCYSSWWLRTRGSGDGNRVAIIAPDGGIFDYGASYGSSNSIVVYKGQHIISSSIGVRPAMVIDISMLIDISI